MARLSKRTAKSRQNAVLRYVVSTDIEKTARHMNVSTSQLSRFLQAKPETIQNNPDRFNRLLSVDPKSVAQEKDVRLVQRLSGQRRKQVMDRERKTERQIRAVRYSEATRERRKVVSSSGQISYEPVPVNRIQVNRNQILNNMGHLNQKAILDLYFDGDIDEDEARELLRKLYKISGLSKAKADAAFEKATEGT